MQKNNVVPEWRIIACAMLNAECPNDPIDVDSIPSDLEMSLKETEQRIKLIRPDGGLRSTQVIASIIQQWRQWHEHGRSEHDWEW